MSEAGEWTKVAARDSLAAGTPIDVVVGRELVLLVLTPEGEVAAFQGLCPHQFARLSEGFIEGEWLRCPHHMARFRIADGVCGPGWVLPGLRRYAVRVDGDDILLTDPLQPF